MTERNSNKFANCMVRFALGSEESFSIVPLEDLGFASENLIMAVFELVSSDMSREVHDCFYEDQFVALRNFLASAETAKIGSKQEFISEEEIVAMTFTRQETTMRISGRLPNDGALERRYSKSQSMLEKRFNTQAVFYCNFPLKNIPAVVDEMSHVLQVIENAE